MESENKNGNSNSLDWNRKTKKHLYIISARAGIHHRSYYALSEERHQLYDLCQKHKKTCDQFVTRQSINRQKETKTNTNKQKSQIQGKQKLKP